MTTKKIKYGQEDARLFEGTPGAEGLTYVQDLTEAQERKTCSDLYRWYSEGVALYAPAFKRMRFLDAMDKGHFWQALQAKLPSYSVLPDKNHVHKIKSNLCASLYTVSKSAQVVPLTEGQDLDFIEDVNSMLENIWDTEDVPFTMYEAGENAALHNLGLTHVGWAQDVRGVHENVVLTNIDPMRFMREPAARSLDHAKWCCYWDEYDKSWFFEQKHYRERAMRAIDDVVSPSDLYPGTRKLDDRAYATSSGGSMYKLIVFYVKEVVPDGKGGARTIVSEYHTLNGREMLYYKRDIKPSMFPFAELYCNLPKDSLVGTSEPAIILANSIAVNLMTSMALTLEYKRYRPPKFISQQSNINIPAFTKYGEDPDRVFVANGDARQAVHYHEYPQPSPVAQTLLGDLEFSMQDVTGVDGRYTGRDTGSIITTGGTEEMLNRVTLIDAPKILNYERYTRKLTELILRNLAEFAPKRTYLVKAVDRLGQEVLRKVEIDFPGFGKKGDIATLLRYSINISSELPKNKQRVAAWANEMLSMQTQYAQTGQEVNFITPEEWLRCQDVPNREAMLSRMGVQRSINMLELTSNIIAEYSELVNGGVDPESAMMATASDAAKMMQMGPASVPGVDGEAMVTPIGGYSGTSSMAPGMQDVGVAPDGSALPADMAMAGADMSALGADLGAARADEAQLAAMMGGA